MSAPPVERLRLVSALRAWAGAPEGRSQLFVAAARVADALGVRLRPPAAWERAGADPVETLCRASRLRQRKVQLRGEWWRRDAGPLLAFRRDDRRPVALLQPRAGRYELFDPASGASAALDARGAAQLDPEARTFYRPLPEDALGASALLRFALRGRGSDLLLLVAAAAAATVLGMLVPQATAVLVDQAIPDASQHRIVEIGLGLLAAATGAALFRLAQGIATLRLETAADSATQPALWSRLLDLPLAFFREFSSGDLQQRVSAIAQIRSQLSGATLRTLFGSLLGLLNLLLLFYYSARLALIALAVAAATAAATVASGSMILRHSRRILELSGRFSGLMVQLMHGVPKLRVAAAEERAFARWLGDYAGLLQLELRRRTIQDAVQVLHVGLAALSTILLFSAAAGSIGAAGGLTTGVFLAFSAAYGTFLGSILALSTTVTEAMGIGVLRERARPILECIPEVDDSRADPGNLAGRIELEHLVFRYRDDGPVVLDDVTLAAASGAFVAVVGPSGSGKSTLLRLVLGLEQPHSGRVLFDGQDLSGLDVQAVRRQLGVVLQHGRISAGSIFENIAAATRISLDDAWQAARDVGFADEIAAMPMGLHTVISEGGSNFSGGQRQRLLLARALVHRPRVLLLDEATSALDNATQAVVSASLERLAVTRIVVAHRLSTIRSAQRIYVLEAGRIVQQGGFAELAAEPGLFARLMARQTT